MVRSIGKSVISSSNMNRFMACVMKLCTPYVYGKDKSDYGIYQDVDTEFVLIWFIVDTKILFLQNDPTDWTNNVLFISFTDVKKIDYPFKLQFSRSKLFVFE